MSFICAVIDMQDVNWCYVEFIFNMAKIRADLAFFKKLETLENYQALPTCRQCAAAEQLNISRGCLRNILCIVYRNSSSK